MKNRVVMCALVGIMLVVIASGTASAATYSLRSESYFNGASDYGQLNYAYGEVTASTDQDLTWVFRLNNGLDYNIECMIIANGLNLNTYTSEGFSHSNTEYTVPMFGVYGTQETGKVTATSGRYCIDEYHSYCDGGRSYNLGFGWTGSNSSSKVFDV
jgi:hypothetical protein